MRLESELTKRVALRCKISSAKLSFLYIGDQTEVAYSKCGRTRDLYKFRNMTLSILVKLLNISPRFLFASAAFLYIWSLKIKFSSTMTPRFYSLVTPITSVGFWSTDMIYCVSGWFFPMWRYLHFLIWKNIFHILAQSSACFRSTCILIMSFSSLIGEYNFASSANNLIQQFKTSSISFINMSKSIDLRTLPWGILDVTFLHSEWVPLITTRCFRFDRNPFIQL